MIQDCKVLVTGGAGFIGSHIAERLAQDNEVIIFDIFTTGKQENVVGLEDKSNVKVLRVDIRDYQGVLENMSGVDYAFHLAAVASVPQSVDDPIGANEHNIIGTLNILEAARKNDVKKVVFSSSAAVYGEDPKLPKTEDMLPMPKSPYAVTKIAGENYCSTYCDAYGLPTVSLRYFNVFGPRQDPSSGYAAVVPKFFERVISQQPPIIFGDGEQSRDFVFIDDVVEANIRAAVSDKASGKTFNVACGSVATVNQIAKMIIQLGGLDIEPIYEPTRPGDIKHSYADVSNAREILNWEPKVEIMDGLRATFEFYKDQS